MDNGITMPVLTETLDNSSQVPDQTKHGLQSFGTEALQDFRQVQI